MIAEGIEAQADQLLVLGCEVGQGYLIGRPASTAMAEAGISRDVERLAEPASA